MNTLLNIQTIHLKQGLSALLFILCTSLFALYASATLPTIEGQRIGKASLSVWGFKVYDAALYSQSGRYNPRLLNQDKVTLVIDYKVNIEQKKLLDKTDDLWKSLNVSPQNRRAWKQQLSLIWTSIKKRDRLVFFAHTQCFQHNGNDIGCIEDPKFSQAFLAIWLSKNTDYPKQRLQLIGVRS